MATYDAIREHLGKSLPKVSKTKLDELADWIYEINPSEDGAGIDTVEASGARCVVGRVSAYGLDIEVDATGNAAHITFPYGAYAA